MATSSSSSRSTSFVRREGLTILHEPVDCQLDLIIIHGLNGHPYGTFYDEATKFYWPLDLARALPTARIMVFGYIADLSSGSSNVLGVYEHGESLLLHLKNNRIGSLKDKRPIVFLGHSLGGLVLKQALVISSQRASDSEVLAATMLICFFGTPHRGSRLLDKSISKIGLSVMKLASLEVPKNVKTLLQPGANESFIVNTEFMRVKGQIPIVNFYEQVPRYPLQDLVVDKDSAIFDSENSENIPVARDHEHLVRFESSNDDSYHMLCQTLQRKVAHVLEIRSSRAKEGYSHRMMQACLRSLGDLTMPNSLAQFKEPHEKTLTWLWEPESGLPRWLQHGSGLFIVTGKPGSGKSVLMLEVATRVRKVYRNQFSLIVQHAFNARGTPREHSFDGFLRHAISQILRQIPSSLDAMLDDWLDVLYDAGVTEAEIYDSDDVAIAWPISSLKKALRAVLGYVSQTARVCFIIDALDECDEGVSDGTDEIARFLASLVENASSLSLSAKERISICISCREQPNMASSAVAGGFRMEERNKADITVYLNDRWTALTSLAPSNDAMQHLKTELIRKADGIFLWAHLALERIQTELRDGATVAELQEAISDIPKELEGLFAFLLGNINPKFTAEANKMLAIVLAAHRPLDLREFRYVMALSASGTAILSHMELTSSQNTVQDNAAMRRRVLSRCGGLLEVKVIEDAWLANSNLHTGQKAVVQFMHQSVRDYLLDPDRAPATCGAEALTTEGHAVLSQCSIRYLALEEAQELGSQLRAGQLLDKAPRLSSTRELPFLSYAAEFCFHHCQEAEKRGIPQATLIEQHFGCEERTFENYMSLHDMMHPGEKYSLGYSLLHLAIESNLASYVDLHLTRNPPDIDMLLEGGQSYVQVAVWKKHLEVLKVLLKHKANVNLPVSYSHSYAPRYAAPFKVPYRFLPPLVEACKSGSDDMVDLLLQHGADVSDCTISYDSMRINQALLAASYSGKIEIVQKLLEADPAAFSSVEIRLNAIIGLRDRMLELEDSSRDQRHHSTAKDDAATNERLDANVQMMRKISELILQKIKVHELDLASNSLAEFWYLTGCYHGVLQRLRGLGTDFSGADAGGFSFFHAACLQGTVASIHLLHHEGGDATIPYGSYLKSCPQLALRNQSPAVLDYLLREIKLPVDDVDAFGCTALHDAARRYPAEYIDILLAHGADKSLPDFIGARPFHHAIHNRQLKDHVGTIERLLDQESDVHLPDKTGLTPLHIAARCGAMRVLRWLLHCKDASVETRDDSGRTVLHVAASCGVGDSTEVLEHLLEHCSSRLPSWGAAREKGSDPTCDADADTAAAVNVRDSAGMTPMHHIFWTYESLSPRILRTRDPAVMVANAKLLLRYGADLGACDNSGNTPLHLAAWRGVKELVRVFLRSGANPHAKDVNGLRPLDLARLEDVRELLEDVMARQSEGGSVG